MIAGDRSGVGKTTVTLTLLASLRRQGFHVQSFKVGPDYIDPMFHQYVTGRPCRNLDPILTSESYVQKCFLHHSQGVEYALIEGVMGLFDGVPVPHSMGSSLDQTAGNDRDENRATIITDFASTAHVARLLNLPVLLILDCSRLSGSIAAIAQGYRSFDPRIKLAGIFLNRVGSDRHLELLEAALEPLDLPILGVLRRHDAITIPDRHLGLVPVAELQQMQDLMERLADLGKECFNWEALLPLLKVPDPFNSLALKSSGNETQENRRQFSRKIPMAIAQDPAFNFYYADNLDVLTQLGAELIPWSPLRDRALPPGVQGLYFGGGFPEVFAAELSQNVAALESVKTAIQAGIPTYAECGGLMYLCAEITDFNHQSWEMVGILPTKAAMGKRLTLGYRRALTLKATPILPKGAIVFGHEFHRSTLNSMNSDPVYEMNGFSPRTKAAITLEGWRSHQVHGSYLHLHWGDRPEMPARFLQNCDQFNRIQRP